MEVTATHKKCPFCAELILAEAQKCRYCGEMLNTPRLESRPTDPPHYPIVDAQTISKGIRQAHEDHKVRNVLVFEMLILASIVGVSNQSWWAFGGVFVALSVCLAFRALAIVICLVFSLFWSGIAFVLGVGLLSSTAAGVVLGIFIFLASYGIHTASLRTMST